MCRCDVAISAVKRNNTGCQCARYLIISPPAVGLGARCCPNVSSLQEVAAIRGNKVEDGSPLAAVTSVCVQAVHVAGVVDASVVDRHAEVLALIERLQEAC